MWQLVLFMSCFCISHVPVCVFLKKRNKQTNNPTIYTVMRPYGAGRGQHFKVFASSVSSTLPCSLDDQHMTFFFLFSMVEVLVRLACTESP